MNVEMKSVNSSHIQSAGYDENNKIVHIAFLDGSKYIYKDVPQQEFEGLVNAPSVGSYLNRNFKNVYPYEKIS